MTSYPSPRLSCSPGPPLLSPRLHSLPLPFPQPRRPAGRAYTFGKPLRGCRSWACSNAQPRLFPACNFGSSPTRTPRGQVRTAPRCEGVHGKTFTHFRGGSEVPTRAGRCGAPGRFRGRAGGRGRGPVLGAARRRPGHVRGSALGVVEGRWQGRGRGGARTPSSAASGGCGAAEVGGGSR